VPCTSDQATKKWFGVRGEMQSQTYGQWWFKEESEGQVQRQSQVMFASEAPRTARDRTLQDCIILILRNSAWRCHLRLPNIMRPSQHPNTLHRGGFRYVQHVPPNRDPTKRGPHNRTGKFLQHSNMPEIIEIITRQRVQACTR